MRAFLVAVLACIVASGPSGALGASTRLRQVSLRNLPLREGERIAAVQVEVTGARFRNVQIPDDWGFDVGPPVGKTSILKGTAQHGSAMLSTPGELRRFLTLAFYDSINLPFTIKVSLVLYRYDKQKKESDRTIQLPSECIVMEDA